MEQSGQAKKSITIGVVLAVVLAACGGEAENTSIGESAPTTVMAESASTTAPSGPTIGVTDVSFGAVLVDDDGRTMYVFGNDEAGVSSCYDECAASWPPVAAGLVAGDRVDATVGSTTRTVGGEQLTVNGRPVYLFSGDSQLGDINGQGLNDLWFVVGIDGQPITKTGSSGYGY